MVNAQLVVIGDELLTGRVLDTNTGFMARRLHDLGVELCCASTIRDRPDAIKRALAAALEDHDIVLASGGLGPTPDDLTKAAAARLFGKRLILDDAVLDRIEQYFTRIGRKMPAASTRQALVPHGAIVLENPVGLAPGLILVKDHKCLILLPGVPIELQKIFETGVVPFLEETYYLTPLLVNVVRTYGVPETEVMEKVSGYFKRHKNVNVAYLPSARGVDIRLWTEKDQTALTECQNEILARLKANVYAFDNTRIEETIGELLRKKGRTLCTAESCTGGMIAERLTDIPGSSVYFKGGAVAYCNELKKSVLGVTDAALRRFGAVSPEVVSLMAGGARERFGTDYALAVSGIAGPGGGTEEKPVGLVYIGLAAPKKVETFERRFSGTRSMVRERAAMTALDILRRSLIEDHG
jgi:nicotinamide-nucleotide amidase